jgi:hypothetical protein
MKKTNIIPIFYPNPKTKYYDKTTPEFREQYGKPGVYVIFRVKQEKGIIPIYVGKSNSDAAKRAIRHFYKYNDIKGKDEKGTPYNNEGRYRVSFHEDKIKPSIKFFVKFYIFESGKEKEIQQKEEELIKKLGPQYNVYLNPNYPDPRFEQEITEEAREAERQNKEYEERAKREAEEVPF